MKLCRHCIQAIRNREPLFVGPLACSAEGAVEEGIACDWCGETDDLFDCRPTED